MVLRQKDIEIIFSLDLISDASREKGLDEATASMRIKCKSFLHALGVFDKKALHWHSEAERERKRGRKGELWASPLIVHKGVASFI